MNTRRVTVSRLFAVMLTYLTAGAYASLEGQPASFYNPGTSTNVYGFCQLRDGSLLKNVSISVSVTPQNNTNGHFHEGPAGYIMPAHPSSKLSSTQSGGSVSNSGHTVSGVTDSSGFFAVSISTSLVAQQELLTVSCPGAAYTNSYITMVGYSDISARSDRRWIPVGGNTTGHGSTAYNQNMRTDLYNALQATTAAWAQIDPIRNCSICTNDAALPNGGKFDITAIVAYTGTVYPDDPVYGKFHPWASPHSEHDRGTAVDVASTTNQCPNNAVNANRFLRTCIANGFIQSASFNEGNHVHCGVVYHDSFPH